MVFYRRSHTPYALQTSLNFELSNALRFAYPFMEMLLSVAWIPQWETGLHQTGWHQTGWEWLEKWTSVVDADYYLVLI